MSNNITLSDGTQWTSHDTRGYLDTLPACDWCDACECEEFTACPDCAYTMQRAVPWCLMVHFTTCPYFEDEPECIGLPYGYSCLDGGEFVCYDCFHATYEEDER